MVFRSHKLVAFLLVTLVLIGGCAGTPRHPDAAVDRKPTLLLISLDGFRWDYLDRAEAPTLHRWAASGTRARQLEPIFPSTTFPNHYTIVTGLYAEHHGIVGNDMWDPVAHKRFTISDPSATDASEWWGGEPLWVTAEKQGMKAGTLFWVGSSAEIAGRRPSYWLRYNGSLPYSQRVRQLLQWLDLPDAQRPRFLTLYFEGVDHAGHASGPDSPEVLRAIAEADRALGELEAGLKERKLFDDLDILVVSDHGMTAVDSSHVIELDKLVDLKGAETADRGAIVGIFPKAGSEEATYQNLSRSHAHFQVFRKNEIPARFHYRDNRRIAPILCVADEGWYLTAHQLKRPPNHGGHGYDNQLPSMQGIFLARGPSFQSGLTVDRIENIHLYGLMASLLGLKPAPNDGDLSKIRSVLRLAR